MHGQWPCACDPRTARTDNARKAIGKKARLQKRTLLLAVICYCQRQQLQVSRCSPKPWQVVPTRCGPNQSKSPRIQAMTLRGGWPGVSMHPSKLRSAHCALSAPHFLPGKRSPGDGGVFGLSTSSPTRTLNFFLRVGQGGTHPDPCHVTASLM